jgi:hypothetical protein
MKPLQSGLGAGPLAALQRIASAPPRRSMEERCEMCGERLAAEHGHVVNIESRGLMCACRPCYLLFTAENAALRYRAVPQRCLSFPSFQLSPGQWDDLQIPVGIAFFFVNSKLGRTVACYPGPAGAAESELPLSAWDDIRAANPELATLSPDVEALIVRSRGRGSSAFDCYLVPIDACYELVGHLRRNWRGFDGGSDARAQIEAFFAGIEAKSRPAAPAPDRASAP